MRLGELALSIELAQRLLDIVLRQPHESEQPVQAERGIALAAADLPILHGGALPQDGLRLRRDVPRATWTIAVWKWANAKSG